MALHDEVADNLAKRAMELVRKSEDDDEIENRIAQEIAVLAVKTPSPPRSSKRGCLSIRAAA